MTVCWADVVVADVSVEAPVYQTYWAAHALRENPKWGEQTEAT